MDGYSPEHSYNMPRISRSGSTVFAPAVYSFDGEIEPRVLYSCNVCSSDGIYILAGLCERERSPSRDERAIVMDLSSARDGNISRAGCMPIYILRKAAKVQLLFCYILYVRAID